MSKPQSQWCESVLIASTLPTARAQRAYGRYAARVVFEMTPPEIYSHIELPLNHAVFDVKWMPNSAKFLAFGIQPNGSGVVRVYEMNGQRLEDVKEIEHPRGVKCGTFSSSSWEERNVASADFEGTLRIWDLEKPQEPVWTVKAHSHIINCIDGVGGSSDSPVAPELVTGSKDGSVKVWDQRQSHPVVVMEPEERRHDCWAVAFGNAYSAADRRVCAGYENGDVKLFDIRNLKVSWETSLKSGVCSMEFDQKYIYMNKLVVASVSSQITTFDLRTRHPEKGFAHCMETDKGNTTVWSVQHLPQDKDIFASTSGAGSLSLWKYCYPEKRASEGSDGSVEGVPGTLTLLCESKLASQPVVGFDWNPHMRGLFVTCAFDQTVRVGFVTGLDS